MAIILKNYKNKELMQNLEEKIQVEICVLNRWTKDTSSPFKWEGGGSNFPKWKSGIFLEKSRNSL